MNSVPVCGSMGFWFRICVMSSFMKSMLEVPLPPAAAWVLEAGFMVKAALVRADTLLMAISYANTSTNRFELAGVAVDAWTAVPVVEDAGRTSAFKSNG